MTSPNDRPPDTGGSSTAVELYVDIDDGWAYRPLNGHPRTSWTATIATPVFGSLAIAAVFAGTGTEIAGLLTLGGISWITAMATKPRPTREQLQARELGILIEALRAELADLPDFTEDERLALEALAEQRGELIQAAMEQYEPSAESRRRPSPRPRRGMLVLVGSDEPGAR